MKPHRYGFNGTPREGFMRKLGRITLGVTLVIVLAATLMISA